MISYGQRIKSQREAKGISQEEAAKALNITRPTYNAIESDKRDLTLKEVQALCKVFGLTLEQFLFSSTQAESYENKMVKFKQIILNCLQYGINTPNSKMNKTKLGTLVYISDFAWYYEHKEPLSGLSYRHTEKGPVVDAYYRMIDELYDEGIINIDLSGRAVMISANEPSAPRSTLSNEQIKLLQEVCKPWKSESTQTVVQFVMEQTPWKTCTHGELIPYNLILGEPSNPFLR